MKISVRNSYKIFIFLRIKDLTFKLLHICLVISKRMKTQLTAFLSKLHKIFSKRFFSTHSACQFHLLSHHHAIAQPFYVPLSNISLSCYCSCRGWCSSRGLSYKSKKSQEIFVPELSSLTRCIQNTPITLGGISNKSEFLSLPIRIVLT